MPKLWRKLNKHKQSTLRSFDSRSNMTTMHALNAHRWQKPKQLQTFVIVQYSLGYLSRTKFDYFNITQGQSWRRRRNEVDEADNIAFLIFFLPFDIGRTTITRRSHRKSKSSNKFFVAVQVRPKLFTEVRILMYLIR